jgi:hypothetical protein
MIKVQSFFEGADPYNAGIIFIQRGDTVLAQAAVIFIDILNVTDALRFLINNIDAAMMGAYT